MSKSSNKYDRFEYYEEDCSCEYCLFSQHKPKGRERGCDRDTCCCEDWMEEHGNGFSGPLRGYVVEPPSEDGDYEKCLTELQAPVEKK